MPTMRKLVLATVEGVTCEDGWTPDAMVKAADDLRFVDLSPELLDSASMLFSIDARRAILGEVRDKQEANARSFRLAARALRGEP
jgi:hypothetical protein